VTGGAEHSAVLSAFGKEFAKNQEKWREHHRYLVRAEAMRIEGDYDFYARLTTDEVDNLINQAELFLQDARRYLAD
jgi:uncharacterized protein (UPF0332 family)